MEGKRLNYKYEVKKQKETKSIWTKKYLTIAEAALYFGIGKQKIRDLIRNKKCSFLVKVKNQNYIERKKMEKFLDSKFRI